MELNCVSKRRRIEMASSGSHVTRIEMFGTANRAPNVWHMTPFGMESLKNRNHNDYPLASVTAFDTNFSDTRDNDKRGTLCFDLNGTSLPKLRIPASYNAHVSKNRKTTYGNCDIHARD